MPLGAGYAFGKQAKRQTPTGFGALRPAASAGLQRHACVTAIGSFRSCFGAKAGASITSAHGCQLSEDPSDGDGAQRVLGDGLPDLHLFPFESPGGDCDSLILRHLWPPVGFDAAWPIDTVLVPSGHAPRRADSLLGGTNAALHRSKGTRKYVPDDADASDDAETSAEAIRECCPTGGNSKGEARRVPSELGQRNTHYSKHLASDLRARNQSKPVNASPL